VKPLSVGILAREVYGQKTEKLFFVNSRQVLCLFSAKLVLVLELHFGLSFVGHSSEHFKVS